MTAITLLLGILAAAPMAAASGGPDATASRAATTTESSAPARRPREQAAPRPSVTFDVATLNVLGSSHTSRPGSPYASGVKRVSYLVELLGSRGIDVAGLQEFQPDQRAEFDRVGSGWSRWPGGTRWDTGTTSIVWRSDQWSFVDGRLAAIPFYDKTRQSPSVLLENKKSKVRVWFSTFHHPTNTRRYPDQQANRETATRVQADAARTNERTGVPQLVMGDMNERGTYYCRITSLVRLVSPVGGTPGAGSSCVPPKSQAIDWVLSSPLIDWTGYTVENDALVQRTTDHAFRYGTVTVDTRDYPRAYVGG